MLKYGHMRVRDILHLEPLDHEMKNAAIVAQFSSIGSTTQKWIDEFKLSLSMHKSPTSAAVQQPKSQHSSVGVKNAVADVSLKLIWPTVDDVRFSIQGYDAGGCLCCDEKNIKPHISQLYHRYDSALSGRSHAMPHIKSYCRASGSRLAWFMLTSANLSQAAWGTLQKNATQLMIRHYELGVLFIPSKYKANATYFSCTPTNPLPIVLNAKGLKQEHNSQNTPVSFEIAPWFEEKVNNQSGKNPLSSTSNLHKVLFPIPYNVHAQKYNSNGNIQYLLNQCVFFCKSFSHAVFHIY
jgi:hypothetical protein